ncbi:MULTISPECIES: thioester domain-containing protein [unclassified Microbacterium]|uniref:thioester domain-containing protein n=1 Tax=unclassified Microbacterium TaxID=2609290 RepID=UPI0012FC2C74|nr:thioester domain-containing protein [Microbacterium sp. MAH-37]
MEQNSEGATSRSISRRTIVKGAAWSLPVIAVATALPSASASETIDIEPGSGTVISGTCATVGAFTFVVARQPGGTAVAGQAVTVTLPDGFTWSDGTHAPKVLVSDVDGKVTISGVKASSAPGTFLVTAQISAGGATASVAVQVNGLWIGARQGYSGNGVFPVYTSVPADAATAPEHWAYCIEHNVGAKTSITGTAGDASTYLGANLFTDPLVQGRVLWVLQHSYPAMSLSAFATAAGVPNLTRNDAIEAIQYAIWRFTDLGFDAEWRWQSDDERTAYWYLVNGAKAGPAGTVSGVTGSVLSVPNAACGTPTPGDHAQSLILVAPAA